MANEMANSVARLPKHRKNPGAAVLLLDNTWNRGPLRWEPSYETALPIVPPPWQRLLRLR